MALIKCPECNNDILDSSKICVHCGFKFKNNIDYKELKKNLIILAIIIALLAVIVLCIKKIIQGMDELDNVTQVSADAASDLNKKTEEVIKMIVGDTD